MDQLIDGSIDRLVNRFHDLRSVYWLYCVKFQIQIEYADMTELRTGGCLT